MKFLSSIYYMFKCMHWRCNTLSYSLKQHRENKRHRKILLKTFQKKFLYQISKLRNRKPKTYKLCINFLEVKKFDIALIIIKDYHYLKKKK